MLGTAAVLAALALAPSALLARYQPVTVLHPAERFTPVAVEGFLADAELQALTPAGWTRVEPQPRALPTASPPAWRLDHLCASDTGLASIVCFAASEADRRPPSVVYAAVRPAGNRIALQYWYWYSYDFWDGAFPATDAVWQAHEGDWEAVTVVLTRSGTPVFVGVSEHTCGKRRAWPKVPRWRGTHPVVHVALGSHAGSFRARPWPIDLRPQCYPPAGAALLRAALPAVLDWMGDGLRLGPPGSGRATRIVRVTATSPSWMAFPGFWGEESFFHVGGRNFDGGNPPLGPALHAKWRDPVGVPLRWLGG
jgi:hypothetical protein